MKKRNQYKSYLQLCYGDNHLLTVFRVFKEEVKNPSAVFAKVLLGLKLHGRQVTVFEERGVVGQAFGDGIKNGPRTEELEMAEKGRRSLHASINIAAGQIISPHMIVAKRPGLGIPIFLKHQLIGRVARRDIEADEWITWEMV